MKAFPLVQRFLLVCALAALQLALGSPPAGAQQPDTLKRFIPAPPAGVQGGARLGSSVAVDGGYAVAGAPFDDLGGPDSGVVKVFDSTTGELLHVLVNPTRRPGDQFGYSVAISGTRVVVGASWDDTGAEEAGSAYVYDLAGANPTQPVATLNNPGPALFDYFGSSVAISGTRVVIGAHGDDTGAEGAGSAYVYDLAGANPAQPVATLNNPAPAEFDNFGRSVAISGTRVVVGALYDDTGAGNAGSAYVYDLAGANPAQPVATLNNPGPASNDQFGYSVAISGTRVVVGERLDDTGAQDSGSAYVYDVAGANPTQPVATLNNPGPAAGDWFGAYVAISGTRVVVGAPQDDTGATNAGSAYVYDLAGANPAQPVATLNNPGPAVGDRFGHSVAIARTRVVVGAWQDGTGAPEAGSAYVYDLTRAKPTQPVATLNNPGPLPDGVFGSSVAISGTRVVVGAYRDDTDAPSAGSAYVYDLAGADPTQPVVRLNNPGPAADDHFGWSVAISGTRVVVSALLGDTGAENAGSAYVYDLAGRNPAQPVVTLSNPGPAPDDRFGCSVAISGTRVVVGAYQKDTGAQDSGSAYVYDVAGANPTQPVATLDNPGPAAFDYFGRSVAISGTRVVVGALLDDTGAGNAGSAYVYDLAGANPSQPVATLNNPGPAYDDRFGYSVAISGTRVVVGALLDDTGAGNAGSAYVYDLAGANPAQPVATLNNPGPAFGDQFGYSVAISGTRVVVGALYDDTGAENAGSAYVYDLAGANPAQPMATLNNPGRATDDRFGSSVAIDGVNAVVGVPLDDSVMTDKGAVYVFGPAPTAPAVLTQAATGVTVTGATLHGTVNPNESGTTYFFEYRLGTDSGRRIAVLSETDVLQGHTPISVSVTIGGLLPNTEYEFWLTATNAEGTVTDGPQSFTTLPDTIAPVIALPQGGFKPLVLPNGPAAVPDYVSQATATDNVGVTLFTQSVAPGTILPVGVHTITLTALDAAGNTDSESFSVTVLAPTKPTYTTLYEKGGAVPAAGNDSRIQSGALWTSVGIPAVSESGAVAYLGKWKAPASGGLRAQTGLGIFVDDTLVVKVGDPVPGFTGATFQALKAPVVDANGRVAFIGAITGRGVTKTTDRVVVSAGRSGTLEVIAREGSPAPGAGNARYRSFSSVSIQGAAGSGTIFVATLRKGSGSPAVNGTRDSGAWWQPAGAQTVQMLVREGAPGWSSGETIKTFQVLKSLNGSAGQGRGQIGGASALIQVGLSTGAQAQVLATPGSLTKIAATGDLLRGATLSEAVWTKMNLPSSGNAGANIAVLGTLKSGAGGVLSANAKGIFASADGGESWEPVARSGSVAPGFGGKAAFSVFKDPVNSSTGAGVAFIGTAKGDTVTAVTNTGIWWQPKEGSLMLVAREGDQPPGAPARSKWKAFTSLALPGGETGPLFTASLQRGPGGISSIDDLALYSVDAAGTVTELLRENQPLLGRIVKKFNVLKSVSGSAGTTRAFNSAGRVVVQVTFNGGSTAIIGIQLP